MNYIASLAIKTFFLLTTITFCHSQQNVTTNNIIKNLLDVEVSTNDIESFLANAMQEQQVPGISMAIINDGQLVYHTVQGFADQENGTKVSDKTIFEGASLSKPLFAYLVMQLVEQKKLDLDTPLYQYLPYPDIDYDKRYKKITARMVLSHTSGFPNWRTDYKDKKLFISFDPGTSFQYSGEGYQYLAKILMHLHNTDDQGLEQLYQQQIAIPIGLKHTKFVQDNYNLKHKASPYKNGKLIKGEDETDVFGAAFSVHSEANEFAKWLIALLNLEGLSKKGYDELFSTQVQLPETAIQTQQGVTGWTLGFAEAPLPFGTIYGHGGNNYGYTSLFAINRDKKWGFVIFTNADQSALPLQLLMYLNNQQ